MKKIFFVSLFFALFSLVFAESWYVCVGSFSVKRNAVDLRSELETAGFQSFIEPALSKTGSQLYRVMIGEPSQSQNDARVKRDEFSRSAFARRKNISGAWICQAPIHTAELSKPKPPATPAQKTVEQTKSVSEPKPEESVPKNTSAPAAKNTPEGVIVPSSEKEVAPPVEGVIVPSSEKEVAPPAKEVIILSSEEEVAPPAEEVIILSSEEEIAPSIEEVVEKNEDAAPSQTNAPVQEEESKRVDPVEESVVLNPVEEEEEFAESSEKIPESDSNETVVVEAPVALGKPAENLPQPTEITLNQNTVIDEEINALSQCVSKNVKVCLDRLPGNRSFSIESMKIFDVDTIRKKSRDFDETFLVSTVGERAVTGAGSFAKCIANVSKNSDAQDGRVLASSVGEEIAKTVNAYALATYKDNSDKSVAVFVAVSEEAVFEEPESDGASDSDEKLDFSLKYGVLKSVVAKDGGNYVLTASTEDKKCFFKMKFENFTKDDLTAFMGSYHSESFFRAYPYIQKTFAILPDDATYDFLCYDIRKIEMDYVEQRGFVEWSMKMLGLYNASVTLNQEGKNIELGHFDFIDADTASNVYKSFKEEQNKDPAGGTRSRTINGTADGFLLEQGVRELSFVTNENIFSLMCDIDSALTGNELRSIAESLKIWE